MVQKGELDIAKDRYLELKRRHDALRKEHEELIDAVRQAAREERKAQEAAGAGRRPGCARTARRAAPRAGGGAPGVPARGRVGPGEGRRPMQKAERLLDLAALLLRASEPVSWREIQEQFPEDYGGSGEAAIRKFERDKAELLELGIPVRWVGGDEDLSAGYLVDKEDFYLPDLKLPPEDLALLYLAGSAALAQRAFPYARDLAHAMNKLSFAARAPGASEVAAVAALQLSADDADEAARAESSAAARGALHRGGRQEAGAPRLRRGRAAGPHRA